MYRSSSWSRVPDDDYMHAPPPMASTILRMASYQSGEQNPPYDPIPEPARKEKSRTKFAENAVHVIPFVLLLCAAILWFFSNPDIDVGGKGDSIAARIEGMTIEGDVDSTDIDGTQAGLLPFLELGDGDSPKRTAERHQKVSRKSQN
ncbi:uncharacterized protein LOC116205717 [Punica granatum]|uniref:Transmembrane protein n=2 Tax=Punica granatum TaxID=22663 RepID=A0A218X431_PUNGR|nr:uncharacterized protein LOC116205717 [Punica granatum]OWM79426.1 hypothetical protein CDL15_Pgr022838 [Punica granatum]PKI39456.1 hypothetical protein CRG98_040132 [Punica granatum]